MSDDANDLFPEPDAETLAWAERVRRNCVEAYGSNPLYQARAARDPDYWRTFYVGHVNWPDIESPSKKQK